MPTTIRQIDLDDKMCHQIRLDLFKDRLSQAQIETTLSALHAWEKRERKLSMSTVVWLTLGLGLYPRQALESLLDNVSSPLRTLLDTDQDLCTPSALCQRRAQLPVKVFHTLYRQVACPLATERTPGAFWRGYRLMAIDSTLEDVRDTPENARFFGRVTSGKCQSPFPQVRCTTLQECGTHALVDAILTPCRVGELTAARRLVRSVRDRMLVLMDRGFRGLRVLQGIKRKGGEVVCLAPADIVRTYEERLPDGSWLAVLGRGRNCQDEPLRVRVLEYTLSADGVAGQGKTYRLLTTLLDPQQAPAQELIALYKERWSIETTYGEIDRLQQIEHRPLRSKHPLMVLQELYAILLGHFLIRDLIHEACMMPEEEPLAPTQVSFTRTVGQLDSHLGQSMLLDPTDVPCIKQRLLHRLRRCRLPHRKATVRFFPRVLKHSPFRFPRKRLHHVALVRADLTWSSLFTLNQQAPFSLSS